MLTDIDREVNRRKPHTMPRVLMRSSFSRGGVRRRRRRRRRRRSCGRRRAAMAAQSTLRLAVLRDQRCCDTVHRCTRSCGRFYLTVLRRSAAHSAGLFAPLYCLPVLIKIFTTGIRRNDVREALVNTARTTSFLSLYVSFSLGLSCVFRALLGCYTEYTTALVPTIIGGVGLLVEDPKRWNASMVMVGNALLERILLVGERETGLILTPARLTYLFMVSSGALLYLLRLTDFRKLLQSGDGPWFFYPPAMKEGSRERVDNASQRFRKELKATGGLLVAGFALQMLRVLLKNFRRPAAIASHFRRFDTYRLSLFLGGYSVLYKACVWALARARGRDAAWHGVPAGLLAGAALRLYPQRTLALLAPTTLLQILVKWFSKKKGVKYIQIWKYIFFSLSAGYLVHSYYIDPDHCPIWLSATLATISGGIAPELRHELFKIWHPARFPAVVGGL